MTHHRVSQSSPQMEDGSSMSPCATSSQMQNTACGQSGCNWYPTATEYRVSQTITPPPCYHHSHVLVIMYRLYFFSIVYTF